MSRLIVLVLLCSPEGGVLALRSDDRQKNLTQDSPDPLWEDPLSWGHPQVEKTQSHQASAVGARAQARIHVEQVDSEKPSAKDADPPSMRYQDKLVLGLMVAAYFIALLFTASLAYRQATNNSPVRFYADPRVEALMIDSSDLDDFIWTFIQPPKRPGSFRDGCPEDRSTTSAESDSVAGGISEDEIKLLRHFNTNELATVKLMKEVHWDCWEELATNIKQKIRQRGFEGLIHVCWTNTETLTVTRAAASSPSSPSRPSVVHRHEGGASGAGDWPRIELRPTGGATGPPSGRRVLRGKISHDERAAAPRSRPTPAGPGVESGAGEDAAPRGRRGTEDPAAPADDQRKVKRDLDDGLPRFALDEVQLKEMIAQGGFASVHVATWQCTPCALKKIFDPILTEELKSEFENEVRMLRKLRHPHVVTLTPGFCLPAPDFTGHQWFDLQQMAVCRTPPALSILTELVPGGSLFEALHGPARSRSTDHAVLLPLLRQSGAALAYLHAMMVNPRGDALPAQLLLERRKYDETVDVFAFGTMIWEVVSLEIPHANLDPADIAHRVKSKEAAGLALQHSWPKSLGIGQLCQPVFTEEGHVESFQRCLFASKALLWGNDWAEAEEALGCEVTSEALLVANVQRALPRFLRFCSEVKHGAALDGFVFEIRGREYCADLTSFARTVRLLLAMLSAGDPSGARSFLRHDLPPDKPRRETNWDHPVDIRDRIRSNFRRHGRDRFQDPDWYTKVHPQRKNEEHMAGSRKIAGPYIWHVKDEEPLKTKRSVQKHWRTPYFLEKSLANRMEANESFEFWFSLAGGGTFSHAWGTQRR
eukprot:g4260.t1